MRLFMVPVVGAVALVVAGCAAEKAPSARGSAAPSVAAEAAPGAAGTTPSADVARIVRTGIERVRSASSLHMVKTAESDDGSPTVMDLRLVTGKGSRTSLREGDFAIEEIVIGTDLFSRDGYGPWERYAVDPEHPSMSSGEVAAIPTFAQSLYEQAAAHPETLTVVEPVKIDGVRCFGVQSGTLIAYFTPDDTGYLRRWTQRTPITRLSTDITELDKPIDLKPPPGL
ncbi:hypothetical protein [Embleya hyalina]|uniref:Lipoprotein n=1 Tax=Embleya hyalina TaxID=516124 RepID=A0A401YRZ0_9ACTN|nr:hypothetical protein [Embleya hyalina]GCD97357.1 hypothetical protein EHYA_05049 [Embleya hyalina]